MQKWKKAKCMQSNDKRIFAAQIRVMGKSRLKRDSVKPSPCVVYRWADGSLTRRPKGTFAVSLPRQLSE